MGTLLQCNVSLDEEVELLLVELVLRLHDLDGHLEGEQQLVALEKTCGGKYE